MNITGNTMLITGGGSGIGRGLAETFHALANQVNIAGRRRPALDETTRTNPGLRSAMLDVEDASAIRAFAARISKEYPALNSLINTAGSTRAKSLLAQPDDLADMAATSRLG